jgi:FKBP-type peptidyl-prolyl cis-trans isomerase SlyD
VPHTSPHTAAADAADDGLPNRLLGSLIAFEFRVFDETGEELGSNVDGKPRIFEIGAGEVLPALERELAEMRENETRSIVLPPGEAYGPIRREAFREFPLDGIPEQARRIGRKVVGRARDGSEDLFDIVEIRDTTAVIDMNHPLAGRTLRFELRVLRRDS